MEEEGTNELGPRLLDVLAEVPGPSGGEFGFRCQPS